MYIPSFDKYAIAEGAPSRSAKAAAILSYGIESLKSFYDLFEGERKKRGAAKGGHTTNAEQDLLRSMLVFSAATLDSVVKQVLKDQIPHIGKLPAKAQSEFRDYIMRTLSKGPQVNLETLARALAGAEPRAYFVEEYVKDLTGDSLQSKAQVLRAAAAIGLELTLQKTDHEQLDKLFVARNQIIHELDYLTAKEKLKQRNRRNRNRDEIIKWSERLLGLAGAFVKP